MRQHIYLIFGIWIFSSCNSKSSPEEKLPAFPPGYSLENHIKITLPGSLKEISGISWKKNFLWAIDDEYGDLFQLNLETGEILKRVKFGKDEDYEELLMLGDTAWVLRSNGDLHRVTGFEGGESKTQFFESNFQGKMDFETLIKKPGEEVLWLICKNCEQDKKGEASIFQFDMQTGAFEANPISAIKIDETLTGGSDFSIGKPAMEPSAAAFHPVSGDLYLLSSVGKWLLVTTPTLEPKSIYSLDPGLFVQPEGLTFDAAGNLYISNEGKNQKPNFLIFPLSP